MEFTILLLYGFVQQKVDISLNDNEHKFNLSLISRRSKERIGLRYLRRGIDEKGNVANFVETEMILEYHNKKLNMNQLCSFVQLRGSIPLFWNQKSYRLKPIPKPQFSRETNELAIQKHIKTLEKHYNQNKLIIISLVELKGPESEVGSLFKNFIKWLTKTEIKFNEIKMIEFDFHNACKGLKYENINLLLEEIKQTFESMNYFWKNLNESKELLKQKEIFRINCIDCLDRTNVVQSIISRTILNTQLFRLGIQESPDLGLKIYSNFEQQFNELWANNGDQLSLQYAGTNALKGDFTRTGKRNFKGIFNDATNSIQRYVKNTFLDITKQNIMDYLMGNIYHEELIKKTMENTLKSENNEPNYEEKLSELRQLAIYICSNLVLKEKALLCANIITPQHSDKVIDKMDEKVFLLSDEQILICDYNFEFEKVTSIKTIELNKIEKIEFGPYYNNLNEKNEFGMIIYFESNIELESITYSFLKYLGKNQELNGTLRKEMISIQFIESNLTNILLDFSLIQSNFKDSIKLSSNEILGLFLNLILKNYDLIKDEFLLKFDIQPKLKLECLVEYKVLSKKEDYQSKYRSVKNSIYNRFN